MRKFTGDDKSKIQFLARKISIKTEVTAKIPKLLLTFVEISVLKIPVNYSGLFFQEDYVNSPIFIF